MTNFLDTPIGVISLLIIGLASLFNIYAHWVEDGVLGRLLYMATAGTCFIGLFLSTGHVATALIILFAFRQVRNVWLRSWRYYKHRRIFNAIKR